MEKEKACVNCIYMIDKDLSGQGFCQKENRACLCDDICDNHIVNKNIESYPVLPINKMIHLESLGFDVSKASCMWTSITGSNYNPVSWLAVFRGEEKRTIKELRIAFPITYKDGNIFYAYTLEDILSIFDEVGIKYILDDLSLTLVRNSSIQFEYSESPLEAAYNALVYLKENKIL